MLVSSNQALHFVPCPIFKLIEHMIILPEVNSIPLGSIIMFGGRVAHNQVDCVSSLLKFWNNNIQTFLLKLLCFRVMQNILEQETVSCV